MIKFLEEKAAYCTLTSWKQFNYHYHNLIVSISPHAKRFYFHAEVFYQLNFCET